MDFNGSLRVLIGPYVALWDPMGPYGSFWVLISFYGL